MCTHKNTFYTFLLSSDALMKRVVSPVVFHKGGFRAIHQSEGVFWWFVPLNGINAVGAVVVAGDDDAANQFFCAFILEILLALLVQSVPGRQQPKVIVFPFLSLNRKGKARTKWFLFMEKKKIYRCNKPVVLVKLLPSNSPLPPTTFPEVVVGATHSPASEDLQHHILKPSI